MKIVAIVQARMGSTRLPGKVLKEIFRKPVLIHDLDRIKEIKLVNKIVVATTINKRDEIIICAVKDYDGNIGLFKGSEEDVLDRYYQAAIVFDADVIVRITSDCPLIDPIVSEKVIQTFLENKCDYCSNNLERTYPLGLDTEIFTFSALERAWKEATHNFEREHVTPYIRNNPEKFELLNVSNEVDLSHYRWTLDTSDDFAFINEIYKRLYHEGKIFYTSDVLSLLNDDSTLLKMCTAHEK